MGTHFSHRMLGTVIKGSKRLFIFRAQPRTLFCHRTQVTLPKGSPRLLNPRCKRTHFSHRTQGTLPKGR